MSKKIIGIKQADGSFYPILEDGEPANKTLELTTVRDGQTAAKINLYKKYEDTEDLEYVDTLLIENLVPHQKEEPSFSLSINLDDDNILTAEVLDPETGAKSDTTVSLVTLSEAQQGDSIDFALADTTDFDDIGNTDFDTVLTDDITSLPDFENEAISDDFDFSETDNLGEDFDLGSISEDTEMETGSEMDLDSDEFSLPETDDLSDSLDLSSMATEEEEGVNDSFDMETDDFSLPEGDSIGEDFNLDSLNETLEESTASLGEGEEDFVFPENIKLQDDLTPTEDGLPDTIGDIGLDSLNLDDNFDMGEGSEDLSMDSMDLGDDTFATDSMDLGDDTFATESMDLGDDTFATDSMDLGDDTFATDSMDLGDDTFAMDSMDLGDDTFSGDSLDLSDSSPTDSINFNEDFDLGGDSTDFSSGEESLSLSDGFDTESTDESFSFDSLEQENIQYAEHGEQERIDDSSTSFMPPIYDKKLKDDIQKKRSRKKYPIAMIICVICAIICIIAVILAFAFGSWPGENPSVVNNVVTVEPPQVFEQERIEDMQAGNEVPTPPTPEENTIEIVEEEEVVPVKPEPAPDSLGESIRYQLVWGDTLWDLSDTYYRNPWLYGTIADANNITNPDRIISGTYIDIPAR